AGRGAALLPRETVNGIEVLDDLIAPAKVDPPITGRAGDPRQPRGGVGEPKRLGRVLEGERVGDAFLFEQALHEGEIALLVLHAVLALGVATAGRDLELARKRAQPFFQNGLRDLERALVLEDSGIDP